MTEPELEELIIHCPTLFHMAERGSWTSIRETGLMSTSALLDYYDITGNDRKNIEQHYRSAGVRIEAHGLPPVLIRDQAPMNDSDITNYVRRVVIKRGEEVMSVIE